MEALDDYFKRSGTPAEHSPVGELMQRIVAKNPGTSFEEARTQAKAMLDKAAGRWEYRMPRVYSPEEQEKRLESLQRMSKPLARAA